MATEPNQEMHKYNTYKKELKNTFDKHEDLILTKSASDSEISKFFLCLDDFIIDYFS